MQASEHLDLFILTLLFERERPMADMRCAVQMDDTRKPGTFSQWKCDCGKTTTTKKKHFFIKLYKHNHSNWHYAGVRTSGLVYFDSIISQERETMGLVRED